MVFRFPILHIAASLQPHGVLFIARFWRG